MAENLFGTEKELSRADKMRKSRKVTTDLTRDVINFLNESMQFRVHRQNNFPSSRIQKELKTFEAFDKKGNPISFQYEEVKIFFKKNNIKETVLDIAGIVRPYNGNDNWAGHHIELEVKTGKDKLSEEQTQRIKDVISDGGISFAFDTWESFRFQIAQYMVERKLAF